MGARKRIKTKKSEISFKSEFSQLVLYLPSNP